MKNMLKRKKHPQKQEESQRLIGSYRGFEAGGLNPTDSFFLKKICLTSTNADTSGHGSKRSDLERLHSGFGLSLGLPSSSGARAPDLSGVMEGVAPIIFFFFFFLGGFKELGLDKYVKLFFFDGFD